MVLWWGGVFSEVQNLYSLRENQMTILWTKCSERMPPDKPGNPIIVKFQNGKLVKMSARWFLNVVVNGTNIDVVEWAPYTPEAWAELNRK